MKTHTDQSDTFIDAVTPASGSNRRGIKTLFITSDASAVAGVGPCLADALEKMDRDLINPVVICPWESKGAATILPRLETLGLPLYTRNLGKWMPSPNDWGWSHLLGFGRTLKERVWSLASLIEREGIDLVYSSGLPCIDGALAARLSKRPHIWHLHEAVRNNPDLRRYVPAWLVEEFVARLSDVIIVNSSYLAGEFRRAGQRTPIKVIHNGVDVSAITRLPVAESAASVRQELGLPADARIVLAVGTVAPRKGYDNLVRAAAQVLPQVPGAAFLIAGAEVLDHAPELRALLDSLALGPAFRLLGPRQDVPRLLAAADVFVHSARQETFGRVLIEAMGAGKSVVSTRCGGPEEIVLEGETGYLVPVDEPLIMADRLVELLTSTELQRAMGEAGRQRAEDRFSVDKYAHHVMQTILDVAGRHRAP